MNTWMTEIVYGANERCFTSDEVERVRAYYHTVPARLRLAEELARLEPGLTAAVLAALRGRYPAGPPQSPRLVADVVASLRVVTQAVLADEPRLLHRRLTDHLSTLLRHLGTPPDDFREAYAVLRDALSEQLTPASFALIDPYLSRVLDALADGPEVMHS